MIFYVSVILLRHRNVALLRKRLKLKSIACISHLSTNSDIEKMYIHIGVEDCETEFKHTPRVVQCIFVMVLVVQS